MVTPPDDKGYKSELKETKALHKELHKVQWASNKNTKLFTSTVHNLEYIIACLKSEKEASEQQLNKQLIAVFRELKDRKE